MANYDDVKLLVESRSRLVIQTAALPLTGLNNLHEDAFNKILDGAILDYSLDDPKIVMEEKVPGDLVDVAGVKFFELDKWVEEISAEDDVEIEFPVDLAIRSVFRMGEKRDFEVQERLDAGVRKFYIRFMTEPSGTPGTWRLRYNGRYDLFGDDPALADLTNKAVQMVGLLTAVYASRALAAQLAKTNEPTIDADVTDYQSKAAQHVDIAKELWQEYQDRLSRPSQIKRAASSLSLVDLDLTVQRGTKHGQDFLVHRRRRR